MKTLSLALAITLATVLGFGNRALADGQTTFQISNQQAEALGQVTLTTPGGNYFVSVAGSSTDSAQISDTAVSVTMNGQIVPRGQNAIIQLQSGKAVEVIWMSPNCIDVLDQGVPE